MYKVIAKVIITLFAFVGLWLGGTLAHEMSHERDLNGLVDGGRICLVEAKTLEGYYSFNYSMENHQKIQDLKNPSELKAYLINLVLFLVFVSSLIIEWRKKNGT